MKVAIVSTWGQECGIATYSEEMIAGGVGGGVEFVVLAPEEARSPRPLPEVPERRCWARGDAQLAMRLAPYLEGCDVVHFQHEFGLFPYAWPFVAALRELQKRWPVVVTLHTAYPYGEAKWTAWIDAVCSSVSAVVVHTVSARAAVSCARHHKKLVLRRISHGTRLAAGGDAARGRQLLGLPEGGISSVGIALGFVGIGKNLLCTVQGFAEAKARRLMPQDARFCVVGGGDGQYANLVRGLMIECGGDMNFRYVGGFVPTSDVRHILAAVDYAVLNTSSWTLSASGAAHVMAGHGVPFACAVRPIYEEGIHAGAVPFQVDSSDSNSADISLVNAIAALGCADMRDDVRALVTRFGQETVWSNIVKQHESLYREVVDAHRE